jgi:hypothetical protein
MLDYVDYRPHLPVNTVIESTGTHAFYCFTES